MALASRLATPHFWRDERLPSVEARNVRAGQGVCYGRHFHETVAIGTIVSGACIHSTESRQHRLEALASAAPLPCWRGPACNG
jgi:hypothetical protein